MCNMRTRCHRQRVFCAAESFKLEVIGLFAAAGGHAFSRGEGGFFIALIMGNEKDG